MGKHVDIRKSVLTDVAELGSKVRTSAQYGHESQTCGTVRRKGQAACVSVKDHKELHYGFSVVTGEPMGWGVRRA